MFQEIVKGRFGSEKLQGVSVGAGKGCGKIKISEDLLREMGNPVFCRVLKGTGKHAGMVAIVPRSVKGKDGYKLSPLNVISISSHFIDLPSSLSTVRPPYEMTDDGLVIDLKAIVVKRVSLAAAE